MGPRPFGRGMRLNVGRRGIEGAASMGPRPFGRGMALHLVRLDVIDWLLQWGRDLSVAECILYSPRAFEYWDASMGPRPFGRGMIVMGGFRKNKIPLQWGRDLSVAEWV